MQGGDLLVHVIRNIYFVFLMEIKMEPTSTEKMKPIDARIGIWMWNIRIASFTPVNAKMIATP
jgi:hypothetical protein